MHAIDSTLEVGFFLLGKNETNEENGLSQGKKVIGKLMLKKDSF